VNYQEHSDQHEHELDQYEAEDTYESEEDSYDDDDDEEEEGVFFEPENGEKTPDSDDLYRHSNGKFRSGNPGGPGRPKKARTMSAIVRRALFSKNQEVAVELLKVLYAKALNGNVPAIRLILEHSRPDRDKSS
jgi:hypothetical protein